MDRQRESRNCDAGNRVEVLDGVELRPVLEQRFRDVGGRTAEQLWRARLAPRRPNRPRRRYSR
jgi:hypothetical protein